MRRGRTKTFKNFKKGLPSLVKSHRQLLGVLLVIFGLTLFLSPAIYKKYISLKSEEFRKANEEFSSASPSGEMIETGPVKIDKSHLTEIFSLANLPKRIIIPSCSIDLPVKPAPIVNGAWELSEDTASFGLGTVPPGKGGNTVIFAHAKWPLFRPLRTIKKGAKVYVLTAETYYVYEVDKIKTVLPNQVEVIKPTEEETLTLFTCTGFADAKRLIVIAKRSSE